MDDRKLLELAAKAAGVEVWTDCDGNWYSGTGNPNGEVPWNPLTDDGDALRLAVKLGLCVTIRAKDVRCHKFESHSKRREFITQTGDIYAATRRAIVRAAASLTEAQTHSTNP